MAGGSGKPVALNNFLLDDACNPSVWYWIDLESGVPALVPLDPRTLFRFYLPRSFRHRTPLFDDVDTVKLDKYLAREAEAISESAGVTALDALRSWTEVLSDHQNRWKSQRRHLRSIDYRLSQGQISQPLADYYGRHRWRWYFSEVRRSLSRMLALPGRLLRWARDALAGIRPLAALKACGRALVSQGYRARIATGYTIGRLNAWQARGQLSPGDHDALVQRVEQEEGSTYLTDFGMHIALKPLVKISQFWLLPALWALGVVGGATVAVWLVVGGAVVRTAYTLGRLVQSALRGRNKPWVALVAGFSRWSAISPIRYRYCTPPPGTQI